MKTTDIGFERFEEDFYANPNTMFIVPNESKDKSIKVVFENSVAITIDNDNIEIKRKLSRLEAEQLLIDLFGTTNIGVFDCGDITDEEIDRYINE